MKQLFSIFCLTIKQFAIAVGMFLTLSLPAFATNYYFSNSGNDSNTGTSPLDPWQTINQLNTIPLLPGDSVLFLSGNIFRGQINVVSGGNETSSIYLGTYGGSDPGIISGAEPVMNWSVYSGNIYQASFTQTPSHFFADNRQMTIARFPNSGFLIHQEGIGNTGFIDTSLSQPDGYWNNATLRMRNADRGYEVNGVSSFSDFTITFQSNSLNTIQSGYGYYFDNLFTQLDTLNEWFYDAANQLLYFYAPSDPNGLSAEASVYDEGISIQNGSNFIVIENLQFEKQRQNGIILTSFSSNIEIKNSRFYLQGERGINMMAGAADCSITGNQFTNINCQGIGAIQLAKTNISSNVLKKIGIIPGYADCAGNSGYGLDMQFSDSLIISGNQIDSTGAGGIFLGMNHSTFEKNILDHNLLTLNNLGGIYCYGPQGTSNMLKDNFVLHTIGNNAATPSNPLVAPGIYLDAAVQNDTLLHNTVALSGTQGMLIAPGSSDNIILDNLIYGCGESQLQFTEVDPLKTKDNIVSKNVFYSLQENVDPVELISDTITFMPATFDSNYYFNPYDYFAFRTHVVLPGQFYDYKYTLSQWQNYSGNDLHSKNTFFYRDRYITTDTIGDNLVSNGEFTNNFDGWINEDPSNISMLLDNSTPLDGGCMKLIKEDSLPGQEGGVHCNSLTIDSGAAYQVHISNYSTAEHNVRLYLSNLIPPYNGIGFSRYFPFYNYRKDYQTVFQAPQSNALSILSVLITYKDSMVWVDNLSIVPVVASYNDPVKKNRLFCNPGPVSKTFDLGDSTFFDLDQNPVTNQLLLAPYSSVILIFDSSMLLHTDFPSANSPIKVFPNPVAAGSDIFINSTDVFLSEFQLQLIDILGKVWIADKLKSNSANFEFRLPQNLSPGIYFLVMSSGKKEYYIKLMIE